jgi:type I restriction enzyme, S subunit
MNHEIHVGSSLPPGWDAFSLGSKASFVTSGSRGWARFYSESGDLFLRSQNIRSGHLDLEDRQHVLPPAGAEGERTRVQPNDLLVTITGNSVGNVAISSDDLGIAYISQHVGMIRLVNPSLAPYACWYLSPGAPGNRQIMDAQTGQSKPGLNLQNLKDLVVAAPKDKQERDLIVAALDDIQAQADEMQILLSKKRMLKQAAMQELLTGKRRLPGFEGEWETVAISHVAEKITGFWGRTEPGSEAMHSTSVIRAGDISEVGRLIGAARRYLSHHESSLAGCRTGDTVMTASGNGLGKSWTCDQAGVYSASNFVRIIRPQRGKADGYFVGFALKSRRARSKLVEHTATSAYPNLKPSFFNDKWLSLPPEPEQKAISDVLRDIDIEIIELEARKLKAAQLKQGMMQQLLTGKIRLT